MRVRLPAPPWRERALGASPAQPPRVLVTGGSGFVGSHVIDALLASGWAVRNFDRLRSPYHAADTAETVVGSIVDIPALEQAMSGCDAVIHLAAVADVGEVQSAPELAEEVNARGTLAVLEACRRAQVGRMVYASTIWVYSDCPDTAVDEETPLVMPRHLYTATKLAGELYCKAYSELYGTEYTILRFGIPYGPRAREAAVVPSFVSRALAGEPLTVQGAGAQSRRFVYVEDLADGVVRGLREVAANRVYNLAGTESVTILEIAETVRDVVGHARIEHTEARAADFSGKEVATERAARELGWSASTPFAEGVRAYVEWRRQQSERRSRRRFAPGLARWGARARGRAPQGAALGRSARRLPAVAGLALTFGVWATFTDDLPLMAKTFDLRPLTTVANREGRVGLIVDAPDAAIPAVAADLRRRHLHASFAITTPPSPATVRALLRSGDEALPKLAGTSPVHLLSATRRMKRMARKLGLEGPYVYVTGGDRTSLGQYILTRGAGASPVAPARRIEPGSVTSIRSGDVVEVRVSGSRATSLSSLDELLRSRGLTAVSVDSLLHESGPQ